MQPDRTAELAALMEEHILLLDGAMGTMIQRYKLTAALAWLKSFFLPRGAR